jgi:CheY-like chemotaxis protein
VTCILIVDDDPDICSVLADLLTLAHQVVIAVDGADAIELIRSGERFDVILSDVMMPRLDGTQLYCALLELAPDQAQRMAFMSSGKHSSETLDHERPCLGKPFDFAQLRSLVDDILRSCGSAR